MSYLVKFINSDVKGADAVISLRLFKNKVSAERFKRMVVKTKGIENSKTQYVEIEELLTWVGLISFGE